MLTFSCVCALVQSKKLSTMTYSKRPKGMLFVDELCDVGKGIFQEQSLVFEESFTILFPSSGYSEKTLFLLVIQTFSFLKIAAAQGMGYSSHPVSMRKRHDHR